MTSSDEPAAAPRVPALATVGGVVANDRSVCDTTELRGSDGDCVASRRATEPHRVSMDILLRLDSWIGRRILRWRWLAADRKDVIAKTANAMLFELEE